MLIFDLDMPNCSSTSDDADASGFYVLDNEYPLRHMQLPGASSRRDGVHGQKRLRGTVGEPL
jgi:hypothetical protein